MDLDLALDALQGVVDRLDLPLQHLGDLGVAAAVDPHPQDVGLEVGQHLVDVGLQRNGRALFFRDTELQLQVVNVYSRRNVWFVTYDFDDNPVSQTRVTQLPRLPNVSFTVRF